MTSCSVMWCGKNSKTSNYKADGITFHIFPKDPILKQKWTELTRRENWVPQSYSRVCSRHFTEDCFHLMKSGRRRLFHTTIPTKNLPLVIDSDATTVTESNDQYKEQDFDIASPSMTKNQAILSTTTKTKKQNADSTDPDSPQFDAVIKNQKTALEEHDCPKPVPPNQQNQSISTTIKTKKRESTDPVTQSQMVSPIKKRLCRRIIELSGKLDKKNKQLKILRKKVGYFKKEMASLEDIINKYKKSVNPENTGIAL